MRGLVLAALVLLTTACGASVDHPPQTPSPTGTPAVLSAPSTPPSAASPTSEPVKTPTATLPAVPARVAPSVASATATPVASTPKAVRAWDVPPKTGVPHLDAIVAAMVTGDSAALEPFLEGGTSTGPCESVPNQGALLCPPGVPSGTPVRFIRTQSGCGGDVIRIDPAGSPPARRGATLKSLAYGRAAEPRFLWMASVGASTAGGHYWLFFLNSLGGGMVEPGSWLWVNESAITFFHDIRGICGIGDQWELPEVLEQRYHATYLVPPPP